LRGAPFRVAAPGGTTPRTADLVRLDSAINDADIARDERYADAATVCRRLHARRYPRPGI